MKTAESLNLEVGEWYWMSIYQEGDIFYPIFIIDQDTIGLDGDEKPIADCHFESMTFDKATMPTES